MMYSIGMLIKKFIKIPDPRKSTVAQEDFMYKIDRVLSKKGQVISNNDHRMLMDLFLNHKDEAIESFLQGL